MAAEGKTEEVARRIAVDAIKFFNSVPHESNARFEDIILSTSNLTEYTYTLKQRNLAASTIIDKLRNIQLIIDYIAEQNMYNSDVIRKCDAIQKWVAKRAKAHRRGVRMQKHSNEMKDEQEVESASNPKEFFGDDNVKAKINKIFDKAEAREKLTNIELLTILAYLAAKVMYKNGQRPGAIQNMTIDEFKARKQQTNGKFLIRVLHHKTAASTGPANLIIGKKLERVREVFGFNTGKHNSQEQRTREKNVFNIHGEYIPKNIRKNKKGGTRIFSQCPNCHHSQKSNGNNSSL